MKVFLPVLLLTAALSLPSLVIAEDLQQAGCHLRVKNYGDKMSDKAERGIINITTGILEMPKNTINTVNNSDSLVLGIIGGAIKGTLHTAGRISAGVVDLLTAFIPSEPIAQTEYVWEDFDTETTYGKTFQPTKEQQTCDED